MVKDLSFPQRVSCVVVCFIFIFFPERHSRPYDLSSPLAYKRCDLVACNPSLSELVNIEIATESIEVEGI